MSEAKRKPTQETREGLTLPTGFDALRLHRLKAQRQGLLAALKQVSVPTKQRELERSLDRVDMKIRQAELLVRDGEGEKTVGRVTRMDPVLKLFGQGRLSSGQVETAEAFRDAIERLNASMISQTDLEQTATARGRDPIERWVKAPAANPGDYVVGEDNRTRKSTVRAAPRTMAYKRTKRGKTGGDGMSEARLDALQKGRRVRSVLEDLDREARRSRTHLLALENAGQKPVLPEGWVSPDAPIALRKIVLERIDLRRFAVILSGNSGPKARKTALRALRQALDFISDNDAFSRF